MAELRASGSRDLPRELLDPLEVPIEPLLVLHPEPSPHLLGLLVDRVEHHVAVQELGVRHGRRGAGARARELEEFFVEVRRAELVRVRLAGTRKRDRVVERGAAIHARDANVQPVRIRGAGAGDLADRLVDRGKLVHALSDVRAGQRRGRVGGVGRGVGHLDRAAGDDGDPRLHLLERSELFAERPVVAVSRARGNPTLGDDAVAEEPNAETNRERRPLGVGRAVAVQHAEEPRQRDRHGGAAGQDSTKDGTARNHGASETHLVSPICSARRIGRNRL